MLIVEVLVMDAQVSQKCGEKVINKCANLENISRYEYSQSLLHFPDNLVLIGGAGTRSYLSDIEAVSIDDDNINCDPTDLPYKVTDHASVYTPVLDGILTCGGFDGTRHYLSKCILQRKGNDSNHFPALNSKRFGLSLTSISNSIYAIGGFTNENTMETINLNTDKQWKQEELPFSVSWHCSVRLGNKIFVTGGRDEYHNVRKTI